MPYYKRDIDAKLLEWKEAPRRKPLLLRGARQVGKSTAIRQLGTHFKYFVEVNLERQPSIRQLFTEDIDVKRTCQTLSAAVGMPIVEGETLLFINEIQVCREAIMALRYFKEDLPTLHVVAAGSLLEFALQELPSFGVGRIRSVYLYPFSFSEFLSAQGLDQLLQYVQETAMSGKSIPDAIHLQLVQQLKTFYLVGGMPAAVDEWITSGSYLETARIHRDILDTYQDDFAKYKKRISPLLLRQALRSVALQVGNKFVFSRVADNQRSTEIKSALHLLTLAGLIKPVVHSDGNGTPLGAEENTNFTKYLFLDLGLMQTMLGTPSADVLLASDVDFVNKGAASEMYVGLELMKMSDCFQKADLYYWQNMSRGANAEIDYLYAAGRNIVPIEVKANTRGIMQSLWFFMNKKNLHEALRISLENFGEYTYSDPQANGAQRHVRIVPLYAVGLIPSLG